MSEAHTKVISLYFALFKIFKLNFHKKMDVLQTP